MAKFLIARISCVILLLFILRQTVLAEEALDTLIQGFDDDSGMSLNSTHGNSSDKTTEDSLDELLSGFEDTADFSSDKLQSQDCECNLQTWEISGFASLSSSYNYAHKKPKSGTDFRGLSRLRFKIQPEVKLNLPQQWNFLISGSGFYDFVYAINDRDQYTQQVLDNYETESELRELYINGSLSSNVDIKIGRQIVVWGKSDSLRVVDILNPIDNREPGMVDIEALRLPITMSKLDYYAGPWNLSLILVHELLFNKNPPVGSDFFPPLPIQPLNDSIPSTLPLIAEIEPENKNYVTEYAFALNGVFTGFDLSYHWARYYDDNLYRATQVTTDSAASLVFKHAQLELIGVTTNIAYRNWLFKSELAHISGFKFTTINGKTNSRVDIMGGVDYSGFTNTTLSFEMAHRRLLDYDSILLSNNLENPQQDTIQSVFRYTGSFLREKLQIIFVGSVLGLTGDDGRMARLSTQYELGAGMSINAGVIVYQTGNNMFFKSIGDNDRLFTEIRYSY